MPKRPQGAPKLKWTEEEELALKAGVDKCVKSESLCATSGAACCAADPASPAYPLQAWRWKMADDTEGHRLCAAASAAEQRRSQGFEA